MGLCATACAPREGSVGVLYRVKGGRNALYLLGSIHVGSDAMYPFGAHILDALNASEVLGFECDTQSAEAAATSAAMMRLKEGQTLETQVSAACYALVKEAAPKAGYEMQTLDALKPWAAMSLLNTAASAVQMGEQSAQKALSLGVEAAVRKQGAGKPRVWLEDTQAELGVLDGFSPALQEYLLTSACQLLLEPDKAKGMDADITKWPEWWRTGDVEAFAASYQRGMALETEAALAEEYHQKLVTERNLRMAQTLAQWLEAPEPHSCFVTIGLLHLALPGDSVLCALEDMGYTVERVLPQA